MLEKIHQGELAMFMFLAPSLKSLSDYLKWILKGQCANHNLGYSSIHSKYNCTRYTELLSVELILEIFFSTKPNFSEKFIW